MQVVFNVNHDFQMIDQLNKLQIVNILIQKSFPKANQEQIYIKVDNAWSEDNSLQTDQTFRQRRKASNFKHQLNESKFQFVPSGGNQNGRFRDSYSEHQDFKQARIESPLLTIGIEIQHESTQ